MTWRPMDTAPRDGTRILIAVDERETKDVFIAIWWDDIETDDPDMTLEPAWMVEASDGDAQWFDAPLGWQPLPDFPA